MTNKTFSVVLDDETIEKLNVIAATKGVARNRILTQLVERYVAANWEKALAAREAAEAAQKAKSLIE